MVDLYDVLNGQKTKNQRPLSHREIDAGNKAEQAFSTGVLLGAAESLKKAQ